VNDLPVGLGTNLIKLLLNVCGYLLLTFQSEALTEESDSELVPVCVVGKLFHELSPDVRHCVRYSTIRLHLLAHSSVSSSTSSRCWLHYATIWNPQSLLCCSALYNQTSKSERHESGVNSYRMINAYSQKKYPTCCCKKKIKK